MHQNRLIKHLEKLSRREMTCFREFVCSPYFNKHQEVQALVNHLSQLYPDFGEKNCERQLLFQALFPGEPHDQPRLALLFTYTMRLLEKFLALEARLGKNQPVDLDLLEEMRQRQFYDTYERLFRQQMQQLEETPFRNAAYFLFRSKLADETDTYFTQTAEKRKDRSLEEKEEFLDYYYFTEKLRDACELHVRSRLMRIDYPNPLLEAILEEVGKHTFRYQDYPSVIMYYRLYLMISRSRVEDYEKARETLRRNTSFFPLPERKLLYNYLQNFCIQRINQGDESFLEEIFQLYQSQLDQNLLQEEGFLSEWHYKNIVTTGLRLGAMEWTFTFIQTYQHDLPPEVRDNAFRYNLAAYHQARREYDKVLELLTQVELVHPRYVLNARALLLRTYYELEEDEALEALVHSFRQYLRRNRLLADFRRSGYANLFRFTRKAAAIRSGLRYAGQKKARRDLEKLQQALAEAEAVFNKGWLNQKVEELWRLVNI